MTLGLGGKSNGEPEFRKRAKLRVGDVIEVFEFKIRKRPHSLPFS